MNLPNKLTLTRIILVPVFMVFVSLTQIFWTAIWPASGTWSPTSASLPTRWPTSC